MRCRFCGRPAIARFYLSRGCVCYPDDREQDLCLHHAVRATPIGSFELIWDYTLPPGPRASDLLRRKE